MANHKSVLKRIRRNEAVRLGCRYRYQTTRNAIKKLRGEENKEVAAELLPSVVSMIDKLAKRNIIHKTKQLIERSINEKSCFFISYSS